MSAAIAFSIVALPVAYMWWKAIVDHRAQQTKRRCLLDDCTCLFDDSALSHDGDSFPRLSGRLGPRKVDVRLISDSMTIRRLPQLWLQVTSLERLDAAASGVAVLVRPSGYEFYSMTDEFHHILETPEAFPREVIVRGRNHGSVALLAKLESALAAILSDPRVKEIAVTREGVRIVRQAGEGRKGEYLLLRQCVFDDATVAPELLGTVLALLDTLRAPLLTPKQTEAAVA